MGDVGFEFFYLAAANGVIGHINDVGGDLFEFAEIIQHIVGNCAVGRISRKDGGVFAFCIWGELKVDSYLLTVIKSPADDIGED